MAADHIDVRMARLEGAYEEISSRLGSIDQRCGSIDQRFGSLEQRLGSLEQRLSAEIAGVRSELLDHRRQTSAQFYWLLTFVLGSILVPVLRDLIR